MLRIGITGGLGSGKSTAAQFFEERGAQVFDADMEAKLILLRKETVRQMVVESFGNVALNEVGEIDFARLAAHAFANPKRQRQLNDIIHPEVILAAEKKMHVAAEQGVGLFVLDVPLLFEANMDRYLDYTIVVVADEELRIQRALERGLLAEDDIRKRTRLQISDEEKAARADFVVHNNGTPDEFYQQLQEIYDFITGT